MARVKRDITLTELKEMAKKYQIDDNALLKQAIKQYSVQQKVIDNLNREINESDVTISKEYVKGRENQYINPAVKELPRHTDSANKTADLILKIIISLGSEDVEDELQEFLKGSGGK